MTGRDAFTPDEWRTLSRTPAEVMFAVVVTSWGGMRRELRTIRGTLRHADGFPARTELVGELSGFVSANADRLYRDAAEGDFHRPVAQARAHDYCRTSARVLRAKATPEERGECGRYVLWCAEAVAMAGVEGGFLGVGGRRLGPAESRLLSSLADALDVQGGNLGGADSR